MPAAVPAQGLGEAERTALLDLLRRREPSEAPGAIGAVNWAGLVQGIPPQLAPMVYRRIADQSMLVGIPERPLAQLRAVTGRLVAHQLRQRVVLRAGMEALHAADLPVIVLKGAALAHLVYPDPALRPMGDVDLWVPLERLGQAAASLIARGLRYPERVTHGVPVGSPPDSGANRTLENPDDGVTIELHGSIPSLTGLSWASFPAAWRSARPATLGRTQAHVLSPAHTLTHVALHAARRECFRTGLLPLVDIALLTDRWKPEWDWEAMAAAWRHERIGPWMLLCLVLARDLLGAPVPPDLETRCGVPSRWAQMRSLATEQLWEAPRRRFLLDPLRRREELGRLRWLRARLFEYYWRSPQSRPLARVLRDALDRGWFDLTVKLPRHVRAWRRGALNGAALRRGAELAHRRHELGRLVQEAGGLPSPDSDG